MKTVADAAVLEALIERLTALQPTAARRWGTLSPAEMLCHLGDATASVLTRRDSQPPPHRRFRKWFALYSSIPWPHGVRTPRSVDPHRDGTRPAAFESDRSRAITGLRDVAAASPETLPMGHGVFGRMTLRDWHRWAYLHTDHHLRQFGI
jgi:hypothetical protein